MRLSFYVKFISLIAWKYNLYTYSVQQATPASTITTKLNTTSLTLHSDLQTYLFSNTSIMRYTHSIAAHIPPYSSFFILPILFCSFFFAASLMHTLHNVYRVRCNFVFSPSVAVVLLCVIILSALFVCYFVPQCASAYNICYRRHNLVFAKQQTSYIVFSRIAVNIFLSRVLILSVDTLSVPFSL